MRQCLKRAFKDELIQELDAWAEKVEKQIRSLIRLEILCSLACNIFGILSDKDKSPELLTLPAQQYISLLNIHRSTWRLAVITSILISVIAKAKSFQNMIRMMHKRPKERLRKRIPAPSDGKPTMSPVARNQTMKSL